MKEIIPKERNETIRQELMRLLEGNQLSASDLSKEIRKSEKEIYDHLEQIKRSGLLIIIPARSLRKEIGPKNRVNAQDIKVLT